MRQKETQNIYESYCNTCNVSAPPNVRSCVHCGGRMAKQRGVPVSTPPPPFSGQAFEEDEPDSPRRLGAASPMTAIWILLFLAGTLYRICA
ncbi:MAG: hypothetical protein AAEJ52_15140 [Myxococcota bacterium]